jgi:hypothetical protein
MANDISDIQTGDEVTWRAAGRGRLPYKNNSGWIWQECRGTVVKVNRVTLVVVSDARGKPETIRRERLVNVERIPF